jgi:hypothetical protein
MAAAVLPMGCCCGIDVVARIGKFVCCCCCCCGGGVINGGAIPAVSPYTPVLTWPFMLAPALW